MLCENRNEAVKQCVSGFFTHGADVFEPTCVMLPRCGTDPLTPHAAGWQHINKDVLSAEERPV